MPLSRWLRELRYLCEYLLVLPVVGLIRCLPGSWIPGFATVLGSAAYSILAFDRRWALRNLELVYGETRDAAERLRLARQSFVNIVRTRMEMVRWTPAWMAANVVAEGLEHLEAAYAAGQGVIVVGGHLGHYELGAFWAAHRGFRGVGLYRPQDNWRVERLLHGVRTAAVAGVATSEDVRLLQRNPFGFVSLAYTLREGKAVVVLIDQNTLDKPVFVDFLGYPAASTAAVAALALATEAPVILSVTLRQPDGTYQVVFEPPFEVVRTGDRREDIRANMQQYTRALERHVLAHPEQYNWPHPRWRFRPDGSSWGLDTPLDAMRAEKGRVVEAEPVPSPAAA